MGGIRHTTGDPDRPPARTGVSIGDSLAGLFAVVGTLAALNERTRSGRGQEVDVAIYEAVMALMESTVADYELGGVTRTRSRRHPARRRARQRVSHRRRPRRRDRGQRRRGVRAPVRRRWTVPISRAISPPTKRARRSQDPLDDEIAAWTATLTADDLVALLRAHDVPVGLINTRARSGDRSAHRGPRDDRAAGRRDSRADVPMTGRRAEVVAHARRRSASVGPALGEHTDAVLRDLAGVHRRGDRRATRRWRCCVSSLRRSRSAGSTLFNGGTAAASSSCASRWSSAVNARVVAQNSTMIPLGSLA